MLTIPLFTFIFFVTQPVPASQPAPWWADGPALADFLSRARRDAADLGDKTAIRLSVGSRGGGLIEWGVNYDSEKLLAELDRRGFEPQTETKRRLLDWADALNRELFNRTRTAIRDAGFEEDGELEVDFSSTFLAPGVGTFELRGTCAQYISDPPTGTSHSPDSSQHRVDGVLLEIVVRPAKAVWAHRETISGRCEITNRGVKRVSIEQNQFGRVTVQDASGQPAPTIQPKGFICGGPGGMDEPNVLRPGDSTKRPFWIETDTLSIAGGYRLEPGRYSLGWSDLKDSLNIPCAIYPATITVLPLSPTQRLARIVEFSAARNRLVITRETGLVEAFDLSTGKRAGRTKLPDYVPHGFWNRAVVVSPDGSTVAYARPPRAWNDELGVIELRSLDERADRPRQLRIPRRPLDEMRLLQFSDDGRSLFVRDNTLEIVRLADSVVSWKDPRETDLFTWLSPDARYLLRYDNRNTVWQSSISNPHDVQGVAAYGQNLHAGVKGWYAADRRANQVTFHPYNSEPGWSIECRADHLLESPDGRYLAIGTSTDEALYECRTEIWSTSPARKLFELTSEPDICFTASPTRVVVGRPIDSKYSSRIEPYDPRFEVLDPDTGAVLATITIPASTP